MELHNTDLSAWGLMLCFACGGPCGCSTVIMVIPSRVMRQYSPFSGNGGAVFLKETM